METTNHIQHDRAADLISHASSRDPRSPHPRPWATVRYGRDVKALITGGAGFIGSHLADLLVERGHHVVILDDLSTGRYVNVRHLADRSDVELVFGSILDPAVVDAGVRRCDTVFHLAAAVGVDLIVKHPLQSLRTNIAGSEIVLGKVAEHGRRVLVTSTSEIYGKNASDRLSEDGDRILGSPLTTRWSYSEAKAVEEILTYAYWRERGVPAVIARLFNTVGPRQTGRYGMVIPRFVRQALQNQPITVYGDGTQTRCFCSVHDIVPALVSLLEQPDAHGQVVNLGSTEEISIAELAVRVRDICASTSPIHYVPYDEAYEEGFEDMPRRVPDLTRATALIGFRPEAGLDAIIRSVVAAQQR